MPGHSKPWGLSSRQWETTILALAGHDDAAIAEQQERRVKGVPSTFSQVSVRTGIAGGLLSGLVLLELGQIPLSELAADERATIETYWSNFPSPVGPRLIESYLANVKRWNRHALLGCKQSELEGLESQIRTTYPLEPQTIRRSVVDWVGLRSFRLRPETPLLIWGPLLRYWLLGYTLREIAATLSLARYQGTAFTTIEPWFGRLCLALDTTYTFEPIVQLVQQGRLRLPGALDRAAKELSSTQPDAAALRLLSTWRTELGGQRTPPGRTDQDPQRFCLQLGVKNRQQAVLVAAQRGWFG